MGELGEGTGSAFPTTLDTNATAESILTLARFEVPNDHSAAIIAIQTALGTTPQGTKTDVKTFLQTEHNTDGTHVTNIAKLNVANTFNADQKITKTNAAFIVDASTGSPLFAFLRNGVTSCTLASHAIDKLNLRRSSDGLSTVEFDAATGVMTQGTVPLARMATVKIAVSSQALTAGTSFSATIQSSANSERFYLYSIRSNSATESWAQGLKLLNSGLISASLHSYIRRPASGGSDTLRLVNTHPTTSFTATYKVYELTEL